MKTYHENITTYYLLHLNLPTNQHNLSTLTINLKTYIQEAKPRKLNTIPLKVYFQWQKNNKTVDLFKVETEERWKNIWVTEALHSDNKPCLQDLKSDHSDLQEHEIQW